MCSICRVLTDCPKCYFDLRGYADHHGQQGALVPQDQTLKNTRSGTKKMLQAGLGKVRTLAEHGLKPHFVHRTLRADTHREALVLGIMAQPAPSPKNTFLIEWCCHPDSELMNQWADQGGKGLRIAMPRFDACKQQTVKEVCERIRRKLDLSQHVRLHISLPCTCWSQWGHLNAA